MNWILRGACYLAGAACITAGLYRWSPSLAFLFVGLLLCAIAWLLRK